MTGGESKAASVFRAALRRRHIVAGAVSCAAIAAGLAHTIWPGLKIDTITVALIVAAAVPWLGDVFQSIELPGGAKVQFRELTERIEAAEEQATRLRLEVGDAALTAHVALTAGTSDWEETDDPAAKEAVDRLTREYVGIRASMPGGPARTVRMERLFAELLKATSRVPSLDIDDMLQSEDPGARLAACARLYSVPDPAWLDALVDSVLREKLPFNKYWGLKAIGRVVDEKGADNVPVSVVRRLQDDLRTLDDTDRAAVLQGVLAKFGLA